MNEAPGNVDEVKSLRLLRRLVTVLMIVMIVGFIVLIAFLVTRIPGAGLDLPAQIELPAGGSAQAFTQGTDWIAVVTDDDRILIFDRASGALRQTVDIVRSP